MHPRNESICSFFRNGGRSHPGRRDGIGQDHPVYIIDLDPLQTRTLRWKTSFEEGPYRRSWKFGEGEGFQENL